MYAIFLSILLAYRGHRSNIIRPGGQSHKKPKKILIVGATGGTGRQLVEQALARGYIVTAFVRKPARLRIENPQLTIIQGDVLDYASVESAMIGQDAVVCALGHKRFFYPARILSQGTRNIIKLMETYRVTRLVCETSLGIGGSAWRMGLYYTFFTIPLILPLYFWDKARQERIIAESSIEWVIVRPGVLTNAEKRGQISHGHQVGSFIWTVRISRADVAEFMLNQLETDEYLYKATGLAW